MANNEQQSIWLPKFLIVVAVLVAAGAFIYTRAGQSSETPVSEVNDVDRADADMAPIVAQPEAAQPDITPTEEVAGTYKDGTYSAAGTYTSPAGPESIGVTLTVKNDVVTDAAVVSNAVSPGSKKWQGEFIGGYKALVVGKSLEDLSIVSAVSGSSLTPKGFNDAVVQIRTQAEV